MSKKKGFRTALATILVVLVIFAALTFAAIKYFLPVYQVSQSEIYSWAVKIYPLLIGITLIVIASMLGKDDSEEESEEDKLPPNAYDQQLFETPKDDPVIKLNKKPVAPVKATPSVSTKEPELLSDEAYSEFVSIFKDEPAEAEIAPVVLTEQVIEPEVAEQPEVKPVEVLPETAEELEPELEAKVQPEPDETEVAETEADSTPVIELAQEKAEAPVAPVAEVANEEKEDPNQTLINAINALVDKMDDFTAAMIYGTEEDTEEDEEEEEEEDNDEEEDYEEYEGDDIKESFDRIEKQISSLSEVVAKLADDIKNLPTQVVVAPEAETPVVETKEEKTPVVQPTIVDNTGNQLYKEYDGCPAKQAAMAEFDSAKDFGYDLTIAKVSAPAETLSFELNDLQCIENGDNTLVIIPFADNAEAKEILEKLGVSYEMNTMKAGSNLSFEAFVGPWIK